MAHKLSLNTKTALRYYDREILMNTTEICKALEQLPLPYLLTDLELNILWSSPYLKKNYAYLEHLQSLDSLLYGYDKAAFLQKLLWSQEPRTLACRLPLISFNLTFTVQRNEFNNQPGSILVALSLPPEEAQGSADALKSFNRSLRAPMSNLLGSIDLLRRRLDDQQPELQSMAKDCYQMLRACSSISLYSEYVSGSAEMQKEYMDLARFLREELEPARVTLGRCGMTLTFDLPEEPLLLSFDPERLSVAVFSLISNSCLYCEGRNSIHVALTVGKTHAKITISDHGYGIPAEVLPHVMEPYYSRGLDDSEQPGIGLGLPLAKVIAEQHGGTLTLRSQQDEGTTVVLSLALKTENPNSFGDLTLHAPRLPYRSSRYSKRTIYLSPVLPAEEFD